jgi:hypothetical protein
MSYYGGVMGSQQIPVKVNVKFEWKTVEVGMGPMNKPTATENLQAKLQELTDNQFQVVHVIYSDPVFVITAVKQHVSQIAQAGSPIIGG